MKIRIWLDDVRSIPTHPTYTAIGFTHICKNYEEAISLLETGDVVYLDFDHDLGEGLSGYDVACWIEKAAFEKRIQKLEWSVHSQNPTGARNIVRAMQKAEKYWESVDFDQKEW
ncbi:MAG: cyclic-phosphate processing receiver domain-containing protein [Candidatus Pacearchaeota archaeon]